VNIRSRILPTLALVNISPRIIPILALVKIPAKKNQYIFFIPNPLILISVNKLLKYIFSKTCKIFISTFSIFYFYFYFYFGLGQPARPGHWPKPVTRRGPNQQEARVECLKILHACMYCAKVINLPSRSAIFLTK